MAEYSSLFNLSYVDADQGTFTGSLDLTGATIIGFPADNVTIGFVNNVLQVLQDGIDTNHILDGAVTTPKLANGAVTTAKLGNLTSITFQNPNENTTVVFVANPTFNNSVGIPNSGNDYTLFILQDCASTQTINSNLQLSTLNPYGLCYMNSSKNISNNVGLTNGQLLIGSTGANPVNSNITSTGGTIVVTDGAGTINLENSGILGSITLTNTTNQITMGTGKTVTIDAIQPLQSVTLTIPDTNQSSSAFIMQDSLNPQFLDDTIIFSVGGIANFDGTSNISGTCNITNIGTLVNDNIIRNTGGVIESYNSTVPNTWCKSSLSITDTYPQFSINNDGLLQWSDTTQPSDCSVSREGIGVLQISNPQSTSDMSLFIQGTSNQIYMGSSITGNLLKLTCTPTQTSTWAISTTLASDTFVGTNTTQTLANKSIDASSGLLFNNTTISYVPKALNYCESLQYNIIATGCIGNTGSELYISRIGDQIMLNYPANSGTGNNTSNPITFTGPIPARFRGSISSGIITSTIYGTVNGIGQALYTSFNMYTGIMNIYVVQASNLSAQYFPANTGTNGYGAFCINYNLY